MLLGTRLHTAGNLTRYIVDYTDWLQEGATLAPLSGTVTLAPQAGVTDVVITAITITPSNQLHFFMTATVVNETFTLDVQVTDSRGEIKNDTLAFRVIPA